MKLKEFDFWAFKLELEESRQFSLFCRSVCAHFERHFQPIETENIYRIIIKISESEERNSTTEESSSVLKYYKSFNFDKFSKMKEISKKEFLLDFLFESLLELCKKFKWSTESFLNAYNLVKREKFVNTYVHKRKNSRNRKLIAELECHHESAKFDCYLKVYDRSGNEVLNKLLFTEDPDEFLFNGLLGDIKWLDNQTLMLLRRDRSEVERFKLNST